jgi:hypothetical protein
MTPLCQHISGTNECGQDHLQIHPVVPSLRPNTTTVLCKLYGPGYWADGGGMLLKAYANTCEIPMGHHGLLVMRRGETLQ